MKLIFLHGLGQSADSWKEVQDLLTDYPSEALDLFLQELGPTKKPKSAFISTYQRRQNLLS